MEDNDEKGMPPPKPVKWDADMVPKENKEPKEDEPKKDQLPFEGNHPVPEGEKAEKQELPISGDPGNVIDGEASDA